MLKMSECHRKNTCYDCDDEACIFAGKKESDCLKYRCRLDCERCGFIDYYISKERERYEREKQAGL